MGGCKLTWIIGVNSFMGYSFVLSDIKVSWGKIIEKDCLQKFYPITDNIAAGFAGSVSLGFKMLGGLAECIQKEKEYKGLIPSYIAQKWSRKAKHIYDNASLMEKKMGCQLIMIGTYPKSKNTIGHVSNTKTAVIKLSGPNFKPYIAKPHDIVSIGSGASINEYKVLLEWCDNNINSVFSFAETIGLPAAFNILISGQLLANPKFGISKHLHIITADEQGIYIGNNDKQNEDGTYSLQMPKVAYGFKEFLEMAKGYGFKAEAAST